MFDRKRIFSAHGHDKRSPLVVRLPRRLSRRAGLLALTHPVHERLLVVKLFPARTGDAGTLTSSHPQLSITSLWNSRGPLAKRTRSDYPLKPSSIGVWCG